MIKYSLYCRKDNTIALIGATIKNESVKIDKIKALKAGHLV